MAVETSPGVEAVLDTIPCALYGYVRWPDGSNRFVYMSHQSEEIFGHPPDRILREPELLWNMVHPDDLERLRLEDRESNATGTHFDAEVRIVTAGGETRWIQLSSMPSPQRLAGQVLWTGVIMDVTERKRMEEEKDRLVAELRAALSRIWRLERVLPICSFCKKIRDEEGHWHEVERYIRDRSTTDFSHGFCPDCRRRHYPGL